MYICSYELFFSRNNNGIKKKFFDRNNRSVYYTFFKDYPAIVGGYTADVRGAQGPAPHHQAHVAGKALKHLSINFPHSLTS